jgi:hypothetical protein
LSYAGTRPAEAPAAVPAAAGGRSLPNGPMNRLAITAWECGEPRQRFLGSSGSARGPR